MAYPKEQLEHYRNLGGINTKVSPYLTNVTEFLNLSNFDFRTPGSLTERDGTTNIIFRNISGPITGLYSLNTDKYVGQTSFVNTSMIIGNGPRNAFLIQPSQGQSAIIYQNGLVNSNRTYVYKAYNSWVFMTNGNNILKFNGFTYRVDQTTGGTIPAASSTVTIDWDNSLFTLPDGPAATALIYTGLANASGGAWTGIYSYKLCWVNRRGYIGPPGPAATITLNGVSGVVALGSGVTAPGGLTTVLGFTVPASYGIGLTASNAFLGLSSGSAFVNLAVFRANQNAPTDYFFLQYALVTQPEFGAIDRNNVVPGTTTVPTSLHFTQTPKYIEVFNNQMFLSGFTQALHTVAFSDIGEPESIQPESNFATNTPLGDINSGLANYNARLIMFKEQSVFSLTGDNPENFSVAQITSDYGCLNNAWAIYNDRLLFLDEKGVVEYNGANLRIVSDRVENIFHSMNVAVAKQTAIMIHVKDQNQIWIGIPCDGATQNNCTVVYDYLANAWTKYEGYNPQAFVTTGVGYIRPTPIFGDYTGLVHAFSSSLLTDINGAFTLIAQSRFDHPIGNAVTKQYRQLYIDVAQTSSTGPIEVQMFPNYGTGSSLTRTMTTQKYQSRIDFGLPATSLSVQFKKISGAEKLILHGFVIASRFQRKTNAFSTESE